MRFKFKSELYEGARKNKSDAFELDFYKDTTDDIVNLANVTIKESSISSNVYFFGYEFNETADRKVRTDFIHWIKGLDNTVPSESDLYKLIDRPIALLDSKMPLTEFDAFIYPKSGRSRLVNSIIGVLLNYLRRDTAKLTVELIKNLPKNIEFDFDTFKVACGDDINKLNQSALYINNELLPRIKKLNYFSIANEVKPKYRKYIQNFLKFNSEADEIALKALQKKNVLIVDDINTSGATVFEMIRIVKQLNPSLNVYVFTLFGKEPSI